MGGDVPFGTNGKLLPMPHILCVPLEGAFLLALVNFEKLVCLVSEVSNATQILAKQSLRPSLKLSLKLHTGSTHANHRSAGSPRTTPEGPARDNPIAGPRTGTTRSEPRAPSSAGASGRRKEPGSLTAPTLLRAAARYIRRRDGERHHSVGKAYRSTDSNQTG